MDTIESIQQVKLLRILIFPVFTYVTQMDIAS